MNTILKDDILKLDIPSELLGRLLTVRIPAPPWMMDLRLPDRAPDDMTDDERTWFEVAKIAHDAWWAKRDELFPHSPFGRRNRK